MSLKYEPSLERTQAVGKEEVEEEVNAASAAGFKSNLPFGPQALTVGKVASFHTLRIFYHTLRVF